VDAYSFHDFLRPIRRLKPAFGRDDDRGATRFALANPAYWRAGELADRAGEDLKDEPRSDRLLDGRALERCPV